jgi:hypothetical protein
MEVWDYEPEPQEGYEPDWDYYEPEPQDDYQPSDIDLAMMRYEGQLGDLAPHTADDWLDPDSDVGVLLRKFGFDPEADEVLRLRAAARFMRDRRLARHRPLPWSTRLAWVLALLRAEQPGAPAPMPLAADARPATDRSPPIAVLVARTVLTAATPRSRATVPAGAAA